MKNIYIYTEDKDFIKRVRNMIDILNLNLNYSKENTLENSEYIIINKDLEYSFDIKCEYCFINMDLFKNKNMDISGNVITYGLGNKNTVTLSSLEEENRGIVYCIQRYLNISNKSMLEPQELPLNIYYKNEIDLYAYMVIVTIALIEGLKINILEEKLIKSKDKI